jgi:hypothetical protein
MLLRFVVLLWARSRVDNAPASGAGDRGFESHRARHLVSGSCLQGFFWGCDPMLLGIRVFRAGSL